MATQKLLLLPGDGIGPEVMAEVEKVVAFVEKQGLASFALERDLVGGSAYDAHKAAISDDAMKRAMQADAVLFGAVGGPKWANVPYQARPRGRPAASAQGSWPFCQPAGPPSAIRRWLMPRR